MNTIKCLITILIFCCFNQIVYATSYTWNGNTSTAWGTSTNWTPNGIPISTDNVTLDSTGNTSNNPLLSANVTVKNFTMTTRTLNLNGDTITINGTGTFDNGTISNGHVKMRGSTAVYGGTTFSATIDAVCGTNKFAGSTFNSVTSFEDTTNANVFCAGGSVFNAATTFKKSGTGTGVWNVANASPNTYYGDLTIINNGTKEIQLSDTGNTSYFGNVYVSNTSSGGIFFGGSRGGSSTFDLPKTISIGSAGFVSGTLLLRDFSAGTYASTSVTLTGAAILNLVNATFRGGITATAPSLLLKNSLFLNTTNFTETGSANSFSYGGNQFSGTTSFTTSGSGTLRLATTSSDYFNGAVTFAAANGNIQPGYGSEVFLLGDVTISGNVNFKAGIGVTTFSGSNSQTISADSIVIFQYLKIDKYANDLTLNKNIRVDSLLNFVKGKIISTTANCITIYTDANVTGASDSGFVSGPVKKKGNHAFVFPTGKDSLYRAIEISAPSGSNDAYTAEFFNAEQTLGYSLDTTLWYVSNCSYWGLARNAGSSNVTVTLYFDTAVCGIGDSAALTIAQWNDTIWNNKGAGTFTGNSYHGKLATAAAPTAYTYFALAAKMKVFTSPISFIDGHTRSSMPQNFYGLNGATLIRDERWNTIDGLFTDKPFSILRYPGGAVANYWGWEIGSLYSPANMPAGIEMPHKFDIPLLTGDDMDSFKKSIDKLIAEPVFDFNIMTSNLHDQSGMLYNARFLNLPVTSVELGNEFYLDQKDYITVFSSATKYATIANTWATAIKSLGNGYDPDIAIVGAWDKPADNGRQRMWLDAVLNVLPPSSSVDALTIHQYIGNNMPNTNSLTTYMCTADDIDIEKMMGGAFEDMDEMEGDELLRISTDQNNPDLNVWITEFNLADKNNDSPGSWAHGLFDAARLLAYLKSDIITKVLVHDIIENNISSPAYFNDDDLNFDWNLLTCTPPSSFKDFEYTAMGSAHSMISDAARNATGATEILPDPSSGVLDLSDSPGHPQIYGWRFTKPAGVDVVILNMSSNFSYQFVPFDVLNSPVMVGNLTIESLVGVNSAMRPNPRVYVTGNAKPTGDEGLQSVTVPSPVMTNSYNLPRWSITHVSYKTGLFIKPTVSELCTGSNTTMRVEGKLIDGYTYTWSVTNANTTAPAVAGSSGKDFTFNAPASLNGMSPATTSTTYTVTVNDGNGHTSTTTMVVYEGFHVTASSSSILCTGATLTGTVTGGSGAGTVNYKWIPSAGLDDPTILSPVATPDSATNYQLFVSDDHCAGRSEIEPINILATPDLGPDILACVNLTEGIQLNVLNYDAGIDYTWSEGTTEETPGNNVTNPISTAGTYSITVTASSGGCTTSTVINVKIVDCCSDDITITPMPSENIEDHYVTPLLTLNQTLNNNGSSSSPCFTAATPGFPAKYHPTTTGGCPPDIYINGKVRLNSSLELINCNVIFGENAEIFSDPGVTSRTLIFNSCTLRTCSTNYLWDGMKITNDNHTIIVTNNCRVTDARLALAIEDDAEFLVENSTFDRNRTHIRISYSKNATKEHYNASLYNRYNIIAGNTFDCSTYLNVTSPYPRTQIAIELDNVVEVQIGGTDVSYGNNTFTNCDYGIYSYNSSLTAIKNKFINVGVNTYAIYGNQGSGIFASSAFDDNDRTLTVGDNKHNDLGNYFTGGRFGVNTYGEMNVNIFSNKGYYDAPFNYPGGFDNNTVKSIQIFRNPTKEINITYNEIQNFNIGMHLYDVAYLGKDSPFGHLYINNNTIYNAATPFAGSFGGTAITLQQPVQAATSAIIESNAIDDARIGIHASNASRVIVGDDNTQNTINFDLSSFPLSNYNEGIWLQKCDEAKVVNNIIANTTPNTSSYLLGIDIESSLDCDINCNTVDKMAYAINFTDDCGTTQLRKNDLTEYFRGINLKGAIGAQINVDQGGTNDAWDNTWSSTVSSNFKVAGTLLNGGQINWYHQSTAASNYGTDPSQGTIIFDIPGQNSGNKECLDYFRPALNREENFGPVVGDSAAYSEDEDANRYLARLNAYKMMKRDTTIIYQSDALDDDFEDFYGEVDGSNAGLFEQVLELAITDTAAARALNESITPGNDIEESLQAFYTIYFDKISSGIDLDGADSTALDDITELPRTSGGDAIYNAAAVLFKEVHPSGTGYRFMQNPTDENSATGFSIYPNPANTSLTIKLNDENELIENVELYNSQGKLIQKFYPHSNFETLNLTDASSGLYSIKVKYANDKIESQLFSVVK